MFAKGEFFGICALALSVLALVLVLSGTQEPAKVLSKTDIESIVDKRLSKYKSKKSKIPVINSKLEGGQLGVVPKLSAKDLASLRRDLFKDLMKEVDVEGLKQAVVAKVGNGEFNQNEEVDLSQFSTVEEKVNYIMSLFEATNTFYGDSAVLRQLEGMGEDAIPALLEHHSKEWTWNECDGIGGGVE